MCALKRAQDAALGGYGKDEEEMRQLLAGKGISTPVPVMHTEALSLYKDAEAGLFGHFEADTKSVRCPLLPTSALHALQPNFDRVRAATVARIGDIVADEGAPLDTIASLTHIFALFAHAQP